LPGGAGSRLDSLSHNQQRSFVTKPLAEITRHSPEPGDIVDRFWRRLIQSFCNGGLLEFGVVESIATKRLPRPGDSHGLTIHAGGEETASRRTKNQLVGKLGLCLAHS